jgi:hypothetical protein
MGGWDIGLRGLDEVGEEICQDMGKESEVIQNEERKVTNCEVGALL